MSQNSVDSLKASPAYDPARYRSVSMTNDRGTPGGTLPTTPERKGGDDSDTPSSNPGTGLDGGATQ